MSRVAKKPLLYNGFEVKSGLKTVRRILSKNSIDIYQLTDGRFMMLSLKPLLRETHSNQGETMELRAGKMIYYAQIFHEYTESILDELSSKVTGVQKDDIPVDSIAECIGGVAKSTRAESANQHINRTYGFAGVAGMDDLKETLYDDIVKPVRNAAEYRKFKVKPINGILLFGPPGCGKTFIARKLGEELGMSFIEAKHSDFASVYVHGTTSKIRDVFHRARQNKPCILFIDELDGILPKRISLSGDADHRHEEINEFLMQLNDCGKHQVIVVAASNRPEQIDEAVLRTGRIDKIIYVSPPDINAIEELYRLYLRGRPVSVDVDYRELAVETMGASCPTVDFSLHEQQLQTKLAGLNFWSCSDIEFICDEAARDAIDSNSATISSAIIKDVIYRAKPSISGETVKMYADFTKLERR